jgi:hypothetical protein
MLDILERPQHRHGQDQAKGDEDGARDVAVAGRGHAPLLAASLESAVHQQA